MLAGGGVRGYVMLGALKKLEVEHQLEKVNTFVGTSIGALVGAALAVNRTVDASYDIMAAFKYLPSFDFGGLTQQYGLDTGKSLETLIASVLGSKYTFDDIKRIHGNRLIVCATNVSARHPEYFGPDTHPDMDVALALRMSCAVPLYFTGVKYKADVYVDGCISDNFPCHFASRLPSTQHMLGITFKANPSEITSFDAFLGSLFECNQRHLNYPPAHSLIELSAVVSTIDFSMPLTKRNELFVDGYRQASHHLKKRM